MAFTGLTPGDQQNIQSAVKPSFDWTSIIGTASTSAANLINKKKGRSSGDSVTSSASVPSTTTGSGKIFGLPKNVVIYGGIAVIAYFLLFKKKGK